MRKREFSIWTPTIFVRNTVGQKSYLGNITQLIGMGVDYSGNVDMYGFHKFKSECEVDMTYFPFDTQVCSFDLRKSFFHSDSVSWRIQILNGSMLW